MEEHTEVKEKRPCLNCDKNISIKAKFCQQCGQKNNDGKVTMYELFSRFWQNLTHLDSKFIKMCWQLFIPGAVTVEYFKGRHKRYPHPVQFFFIVMFFFLFVFNHTYKGLGININIDKDGKKTNMTPTDQNASQIYESLKIYTIGKEITEAFAALPAKYKTDQSQIALDSIVKSQNPKADILDNAMEDTINFQVATESYKIRTRDIILKSPEEILQVYNISDWKSKIIVKQAIKTFKDPKSLINAYIGSISWTVIALITTMSLVFMLLYRKSKPYYVEHFVFLMHQHTMHFFLFTLLLLLGTIIEISSVIWGLAILGIIIHSFFAMKNYYKQSTKRTLMNWFVYHFFNFVFLIVFFVAGVFAVFAVF
jgi:Protein of unknown function (DUF3667)